MMIRSTRDHEIFVRRSTDFSEKKINTYKHSKAIVYNFTKYIFEQQTKTGKGGLNLQKCFGRHFLFLYYICLGQKKRGGVRCLCILCMLNKNNMYWDLICLTRLKIDVTIKYVLCFLQNIHQYIIAFKINVHIF